MNVFGASKYAVRIQLDPDELANRGIGVDEVQNSIQQNNSNIPTGKLFGARQAFTIQSTGQLNNAAQFRRMIVAYKNGNPVRLEELGQVIDDVENNRQRAWKMDSRAVILAINRQPGTNTVEVVDAINGLMPTFRAEVPPSISMEVLRDRSIEIRNSINDVKFTLLLTVCLVVMVIFLFLRNFSATVIPGIAVPLSIVGTFAVMYLLGYSLNNLSLMALTLSVGFVVDDAIVMLENIVRHMEAGESRMDAALRGSREIGFTIVSMTISLVSVFIPVLFMGGIVGRLLHEFAVTIAVAILVSGFISLTLTPMLGSKFLRFSHKRHGILYNAIEFCLRAMNHAYERSLRFRPAPPLRHARTGVCASRSQRLAFRQECQKGFLPSTDADRANGIALAGQGHLIRLAGRPYLGRQKHPRARPERQERFRPGGHNNGGGNQANAFLTLKPRKERALDVDHVNSGTAAQTAGHPGNSGLPAKPTRHPDWWE